MYVISMNHNEVVPNNNLVILLITDYLKYELSKGLAEKQK